MHSLHIVLVTYNSRSALGRFFGSFKKLINYKGLIIVDNASTDGTTDALEKEKSGNDKISLIRNRTNEGFSKAANTGIKAALKRGAEYVLLINPDTSFDSDFTKAMSDSESHISSPVIGFTRDGSRLFDMGGIINRVFGRTYHLEKKIYPGKEEIQERIPDYVSGCCMMVRRDVFESAGFFDERFFMYFEDVDFCIRAKNKGFRISVADSLVIHDSAEGKEKPFHLQLLMLKSNLLFIIKHMKKTIPLGLCYICLMTFTISMRYLWKKFPE